MITDIYKFIDEVIEVRGESEVNKYLKQGYILLNTYAIEVRDADGVEGFINYSLGHVNVLRSIP